MSYTNKLYSNFQKGWYMTIVFNLKVILENTNFNCIMKEKNHDTE